MLRSLVGSEMCIRDSSWHVKIWMPQLPAGKIKLSYDLVVEDDIPTFEVTVLIKDWTPARPVFKIQVNGLSGTDTSIVMTGLDTELKRDVTLNMTLVTESDLIIPRTTIDAKYDIGERLDTAHILQNNRIRGIRTEMILFDAPGSANLYSKIGDILQTTLNVTPMDRICLLYTSPSPRDS